MSFFDGVYLVKSYPWGRMCRADGYGLSPRWVIRPTLVRNAPHVKVCLCHSGISFRHLVHIPVCDSDAPHLLETDTSLTQKLTTDWG